MPSNAARSSTWASSLLGAGALLGACALLGVAAPRAALAQHADAGVEKAAVPAEPPAAEPPAAEPPAAEPPAPDPAPPASEGPSGVLPKVVDPAQLSEGVRARLAERAGVKPPSGMPPLAPRPEASAEPAAGSSPSAAPYRPRLGASEPLRRGQARPRVQAVETDEGVTLLSNRIQLPEPRLSPLVARRAAPPAEPEAPLVEEEALVVADEAPSITETHSLRPMSARSARSKSDASAGLGWLLWPFVLFLTTGAVVGTLWFRKKTE